MEQQTTRRKYTRRNAEAEITHKPADVVLPASGGVEHESVIERVSDLSTVGDKAKMMKFMEEPVEIMINESTDPNAENAVFCAVNGEGALVVKGHRTPWIPRGVAVTIRRKFVERLARARRIGIRTDEVRDGNGDRTTAIRRSSALAYQFTVLRDENPNGSSWLRRVLAEA